MKAVRKPSAKCERAVVCLAPAEVEKIRNELIARDQLYAATMVSLIAYQGLRTPEELLGVEVRHIRKNTVLVEQRNIVGKIVGGQKVRGFHPRAIDLLDPVRRDVQEYLLATGIRAPGAVSRRDGEPWRLHDYNDGRRRVWKRARGRRVSSRYRRMTCATRSPVFRSEPACRFVSWRSRWGTRRR